MLIREWCDAGGAISQAKEGASTMKIAGFNVENRVRRANAELTTPGAAAATRPG